MSNTPNRQIPYVPENTLDPAAGLNASLDVVDAVIVPKVIRMDLTAPPGGPADGDLYIVASPATGAWAGLEGYLVRYRTEGAFWQSWAPTLVNLLLNADDSFLYKWDTSVSPAAWTLAGGGTIIVEDQGSPPTSVDPTSKIVFGEGLDVSELEPGTALVELTDPGGGSGGGGDVGPGLDLETEIMADTPYAYWKLDDAGATAEDISGNNRDLTYFGAGVLQFASVKPADYLDKTAKFPAGRIGAGVANSLGLSLPITGDWTFECLISPLAGSGQVRLFNVGGDGGSATAANNEQIAIFINNGEFQVFWEHGAGSANLIDPNIALGMGRAYHLAARKNGTANTVDFFVNGILLATTAYSNEPADGSASIASVGAPNFASSAHVGGIMGHAAFWTSILSADRIAVHAAAAGLYGGSGVAPQPINDAGLTPDTTPASPNAADDEFDEGATIDTTGGRRAGATAWAWRNQSTSTATQAQGHLKLLGPQSTTTNLRVIEQVAPAGAWKYRAKLATPFFASGVDFALVGMVVVNNSNGRLATIHKITSSGKKLGAITWSSVTGFNAAITAAADIFGTADRSWTQAMYFEIESDATTLTFRYSDCGSDGSFITFGSQAIATYLGAVDRIGLFVNNDTNNNAPAGIFEWFRRVA